MTDFKRQVDARVNPKIDALMRGVVLEHLAQIVDRTPVDTGRARANWHASVRAPDTSTDPEATNADVPNVTRTNMKRLGRWDAHRGIPGYVANGLPYVGALENGHSTQAPNGMVRLAIRNLSPTVRRIAAKIRRMQSA